MKLFTFAMLGLAAQQTSAFPSYLSDGMIQTRNADHQSQIKHAHIEKKREIGCPFTKRDPEAEPEAGCPFSKEKRQAPGVIPPFDAAQQHVSITGAHAFVAPGPNDQRGPCPGLNAMANHGYLPHNGVGQMSDFVSGTAAVFGMGADLAEFIAVYTAVFDGNLLSLSIGGPVNGLLSLGGLLGTPEGLSGSHNKFEGDGSPTRGDLYQYGNDYKLQLSQFKALYELGQQNGDSIDLPLLASYRATRFQDSISNNPWFFNAPFAGVVANAGAWSFIYRFMANKSAEYPEGHLDGETLKSFFSITGSYPNFQHTPGHEKIPNNWYKRNLVDYYTFPYVSLDIQNMALAHPEFLSVGGNTGKVNTFTGIDPQMLTGGVFNAQNLLQGNNAICFGLEASLQEAPDFLSGLYSDINPAMDMLGTAINQATNGLGCPKLNTINKSQFGNYPGYKNLKADGTY